MRDSFLRSWLLVLGWLVASALHGAVSAHAESRTFVAGEAQNGGAVALRAGDRLVVRLPAQPGTGFSWAPASAGAGPLRLSGQRVESRAALPGGTQTQVFTFRAAGPGTTELRLAYRRPWLPQEPAGRSFSLTVTVR